MSPGLPEFQFYLMYFKQESDRGRVEWSIVNRTTSRCWKTDVRERTGWKASQRCRREDHMVARNVLDACRGRSLFGFATALLREH